MSRLQTSPENEDKSFPWDLTQESKYLDMGFLVEDKVVYGNKAVLCMWSPVFSIMLEGYFKESKMDKIPLPGKKYDSMMEFMRTLHPPWRNLTSRT